MNFKQSGAISGHLAALFTMLIWGTTFISTKILLKSFTPIEILLVRFIIGYVVLLLVYPHFIKVKSFKEETLFAAAGFLGIMLYYMLENTALTYTLASNVGVFDSIIPFFTAILAHFLLKTEKLHASFFIGLVTSAIGVLLINFSGSFILKLNPLGDTLAVLAGVAWAFYSILSKIISDKKYNTIACTRRVFFYGILFMIPISSFMGIRPDFGRFLDGTNLFNLLFLGFGASALCFVTWNYSVGTLGAVKTSVYIYLVPVVTIISSVLVLHENITWVAALRALLTMVGLFVSEKKKKSSEGTELNENQEENVWNVGKKPLKEESIHE
jgi:drug/metabolite transporter (DMT)-like permease